MADVDIDPFGEHDRTESRPEEPTGENIPLTPVGGRSTWEPECEQETLFGGLSGARVRLNAIFVEDKVNGLYEILSEHFTKNQEVIYYDDLGQSLLHRHFHQLDHSVEDIRVQILEKIYHSSENPTLITTIRRTRELFWIKELGTAKPYGFNDQIKGVSTLSSISCKKSNIYSLFNKQPRRKRSHEKRHYNKRAPQPDVTMSTLVDLVDMTEKPEGVHKINSKLFSISFPQLRHLQEVALESTNFECFSSEYRVTAIILDIAHYRLFRPVEMMFQQRSPSIL